MSASTPLGRFTSDGTVSGTANALRGRGVRICSFERLTDDPSPPPIHLPAATVAEALDALVARHPDYAWAETAPLLRVAPTDSLLDEPTPAVSAAGQPLATVLARLGTPLDVFGGLGDPDGPLVTLDQGPATVGAVLDAVVLGLGRSAWHIAGRPGDYVLSLTVVEG